MPKPGPLFAKAIAALDAVNALDPHREADGTPHELADSKRVTAWVHRLIKEPPESLLLAARASHLGRWDIPRSGYPEGKKGYLQWRRRLYAHQAEKAGEILTSLGYDEGLIREVRDLVEKKEEKGIVEDALCLVFLENEFEAFRLKHDEAKLLGVVRKTWAKMGDEAKRLALGLGFSMETKAILKKALE